MPIDVDAPKIFSFSEFLTGLALMVLAWTIADIRYRFRISTSPLPLRNITFGVVSSVGVLTLLTELWRAEEWFVLEINIITLAVWQTILGGLLLLTFLTWAWFAFIRPPRYGKRNSKRYAQSLYRVILKGSPAELSVIADELAYSVKNLIQFATDRGEFRARRHKKDEETSTRSPEVISYANDIFLLIADKRFCRAIVDSSPNTALAIFNEIGDTKKYGIQVETFAKNIVHEALVNKDSFIFHETEGYESGLIGYIKPLSQAMFSNYKMVESIGTLLDPDIFAKEQWDANQWEAYCRVVLMTFQDYVENDFYNHSFVLYRAKGYIENAVSDLYKLNGMESSSWDEDSQARLRVVVKFIQNAIKILDKKGAPRHIRLRVREESIASETFYDHLASMIFEVIFHASAIKSPRQLNWWIQHNAVWTGFFNFGSPDGIAAKVVKFKVRRLIYEEIIQMNEFPNFKGAKILGFCLNVMGLTTHERESRNDSKALHKVILSWTRKNYAWLHSYNPRVAEACLVDDMTYDSKNLRLVQTYPANGLRRMPHHVYLDLDNSNNSTKKF